MKLSTLTANHYTVNTKTAEDSTNPNVVVVVVVVAVVVFVL